GLTERGTKSAYKRLSTRKSSTFKVTEFEPAMPCRAHVLSNVLPGSWTFGVIRPEAGRMRCPSETLGKGKGERKAGKGRETATWRNHEHQKQPHWRPAGLRCRAARQHVPQHPRGGGGRHR